LVLDFLPSGCFALRQLALLRKVKTLVRVRAPVGDINLIFQRYCTGRGLTTISYYTYYLTMTFAHPREDIDSLQNSGTTDMKLEDSTIQRRTLLNIVDSLLPKLMSGKIRVPVEAR
jgi:hypothetical protein